MGFIADYISCNGGNEAPVSFWFWSGLNLMGHILGKKVWLNYGQFPITPQTYVALIGSPSSGKTTARLRARRIMIQYFPTMLISDSVQSFQDIAELLTAPEVERQWAQPGVPETRTYRPFYIMANEFKAFLSVDPANMVAFLEDIYDDDTYSTGFKKDRAAGKKKTVISNPCVSLLANAVPEWLMRELKVSLFNGGLGSRVILVVDEPETPVDWPGKPEGYVEQHRCVIDHLIDCCNLVGEVTMTPDGRAWWKDWYYNRYWGKRPDDPILGQFHSRKKIQILKIATLLALDSRPFKMSVDAAHLEAALEAFDRLIPRIQQLTSGVGHNILAGYATQIAEVVRINKIKDPALGELVGLIEEKRLYARTWRDAPNGKGEKGYVEALLYLQETGQLKFTGNINPISRRPDGLVFTSECWEEYLRRKGAGK